MTTAEFTIPLHFKTNRVSPLKWILSHTARQWWLFLIMAGGAFGNAALAAAAPILTGQAFDAINQPTPDTSVLPMIAFWIVFSQVVRSLLQFGRNYSAEVIAQRMERDIRSELYTSLLGKSMTFHNLQPIGDTMARATNDVREVNLMFSPGINLVIGSFFFLVMPILAAPNYHPALLATPVAFAVLYFLALARYLVTLEPISDEVRASFGEMNTHLSESLDGVETVKGAAQENAEVEKFVVNAQRVREAFIRQGDTEARFVAFLLYGLAIAAGLTHALILFRAGLLNTGQVIGYFGLLRMLDFPTFTSTWAYTQVSMGLSGARRVLELMNRENNLGQNAAGYSGALRGEIEFRNVRFGYGEDVLKDISFKVHPGQTVAIVGQTGAGKTSLVRLVNRTYDASAGQILVDGVDVRDWNLAALRSQISMIEQDIFLFSRSISDNIAFGKPDASQQDIQSAAEAAQAHEFILTFDQGYQTVIGERPAPSTRRPRTRFSGRFPPPPRGAPPC